MTGHTNPLSKEKHLLTPIDLKSLLRELAEVMI
jgi:hypothetical protein